MPQNNLNRWEKEQRDKDRARSRNEFELLKQKVNSQQDGNVGVSQNEVRNTDFMARTFVAGLEDEDINGLLIANIAETGVDFQDGDFLLDQPTVDIDPGPNFTETKLYQFHHNQWNLILGSSNTLHIVPNYADLPTGSQFYGHIGLTTVNPLNVGWMNVIADGQSPTREWVSTTHFIDENTLP